MSDEITIITNNIPRDIIDACELTDNERKEFDYLNWAELEDGSQSASFVRYKNWVYDLNDTEGIFRPDTRWFYISDSFFSGVLFRYADERAESIICGRYYC